MGYLYLIVAIISEVIATSALKETLGFSKLLPSLIVVKGYSTSFYFLSLVLKYLPIGITYAIWSGAGIVLLNLIGYLIFNLKKFLIPTPILHFKNLVAFFKSHFLKTAKNHF